MPRRRDLFKAPAFLLPFAATAAAKLPNATLSARDARLTKEPFGDHLVYFDGPTDQLSLMTAGSLRLKPGMTPHPPHEHEEEEFMLVTEGNGDITLDGKVTKVGPGSLMYSAAGRSHGILNSGKTPLLFYYWKWKR